MNDRVRKCTSCHFSEPLVPSGRLVCMHPEVNIPTPAFLSGNHAIARSCLLERGARRGACGPAGLCWSPRPDDRSGLAPVDRFDV